MTREAAIEAHEYVVMQFIQEALGKRYRDFKSSFSQLTFDEIERCLLSQGDGRGNDAIGPYIQQYLNFGRSLTRINQAQIDLENSLKEKIASLPLFNVGLERFVYDSLISELVTGGFDYETFISPNSSDHAFLLPRETILRFLTQHLTNLKPDHIPLLENFLTSKKAGKFQGVLIHIDAKSIMAMSNAGDAIKNNRPLQFEAKWNQVSYNPPRLRNARLGPGASERLTQKYQTLPTFYRYRQKDFLVLSYFVPCLIYIDPNSQYINDAFNQISGSHFKCVTSLCSLPNGDLESSTYDRYFFAGKGGKEGVYPKDCRFRWGLGRRNLHFLNLPTLNVKRGHYFDLPGNYSLLKKNQGVLVPSQFQIP